MAQRAGERIVAAARDLLRAEIRSCRGNEVFFLGRLDGNGVVVEVEALARGNEAEVPALLRVAEYGDVVLHNHPGGRLEPSDADMSVACALADGGVGFYILDNSIRSVYVVVEPFAPRTIHRLDAEKVAHAFAREGEVATRLPGYEHRPEQESYARRVAETFNDDGVAMIEAGTGIGKSLAYLLPALRWALANKERVVVSTNTINLQQQLIGKDLPFLAQGLGIDFRAVLVKGRSNYLCHRKLQYLAQHGVQLTLLDLEEREEGRAELRAQEQIARIVAWAEKTRDGSRADLGFLPSPEVWEAVASSRDGCLRLRCPHYRRCFFYEARREASSADLLVVNHHVLMADLAIRREADYYSGTAILPPYSRVILDEAHNLEEAATRFFGASVTEQGLTRTVGRLRSKRHRQRGLLPHLAARLGTLERQFAGAGELGRFIEERLQRQLDAFQEEVVDGFALLGDWVARHGQGAGRESKLWVTEELEEGETWTTTRTLLARLSDLCETMAARLKRLMRKVERLDEEAAEELSTPLAELNTVARQLEGHRKALLRMTRPEAADCRWFERRPLRQGVALRLSACPVEVAEPLREALFRPMKSTVLTSATLTVDGSFAFLAERIGLGEDCEASSLILPSPFDYRRQAFVAVPIDLPDPKAPGFFDEYLAFLRAVLQTTEGRALVLFTSFAMLRKTERVLSPFLEAMGIRALRQGQGDRHQLLECFRKDEHSVLFATSSFWEGVDVQGASLSCVILSKLPFRVPSEPIERARCEWLRLREKDPFRDYSLPLAILKFKQGFGRLIRSKTDRGAVFILDRRVVSKAYGQTFLRSLPPCHVHRESGSALIEKLETFVACSLRD